MDTFGLERQSMVGSIDLTASFELPPGKNLLPNASFELGGHFQFDEFWQRPTGWGEFYNPLTLNLVYRKQHPKKLPSAGRYPEIPHGEQCAQIPLEDDGEGGWRGHLTSSMIQVKPGQAYVLSAFARSSTPGARLRLGLWTRPLDWKEDPEAHDYFNYDETHSAPQSEWMDVGHSWNRFVFPFMIMSWRDCAVVDLSVSADGFGDVLVDAVQLEEGWEATEFDTRHLVEAAIEDRRPLPLCKLHFMDQPITFYVALFNNCATAQENGLRLDVYDSIGETVLTANLTQHVPPGASVIEVIREFCMVGDYTATVYDGDGVEVCANRYAFRVQPAIPDRAQFVIVSRHGKPEEVPAERVYLPWKNEQDWYADPPQGLTVTEDNRIYASFYNENLLRTDDGGRTWHSLIAAKSVMGVLRSGAMLCIESVGEGSGELNVFRSEDEAQSWERIGGFGSDGYVETVSELRDGTIVTAVAGDPNRCHRSTDGGATWSQPYPICPGGEAHIIELSTGRLLCVARYRPQLPRDQWDMWLKYPNSIWWFTRGGSGGYGSHLKCVLLANSDDGGHTWGDVRRGTFIMETMHGSAVELPDGRIVLLHVSRAVSPGGGTWAKVSSDCGYTWETERYYLNASPSYPGYSASCVLPPHLADGEEGMILTIAGERSSSGYPARAQAVRWRPLSGSR